MSQIVNGLLRKIKLHNLEKFFNEVDSISDFSKKYFEYLSSILNNIDTKELNKLELELDKARLEKKNIFVIGNGGSATTASSMVNDLGFDILKKTSTKNPFKFISLVDNNSSLTAIPNDTNFENVFINQLKIHFNSGDFLIAISASGNSSNIIKAAEYAKSNGGKVVGFIGFDGGKLAEISDIRLHVNTLSGEYGPVEDSHLILNHILAHWFQNKLK